MSYDKCSPLYDIHKSYLENAEEGPFFEGQIPERVVSESYDFLGFRVNSRIGIPAGPLLNAKWIKLAADLHYDILCYKTIRTKAYSGHPVPNIVFIDAAEQLADSGGSIYKQEIPPASMTEIGITNSFGMPSRTPEYLRKDIPLANQSLHAGQVMIVSVVGSAEESDFFQDFVNAALFAKECGASIVEGNFSCPNVGAKEGSLYLDPGAIFLLTQRIVKAIHPTPFIVKVGCYLEPELLREACLAVARGGARAISGINTISRKIITLEGEPALGKSRPVSGVCGTPIRAAALQFVRQCRGVIDDEKLELELIGCGGITMPEHFDQFFDAGASIAMTATGMMWNPYLAEQYSHKTERIHV